MTPPIETNTRDMNYNEESVTDAHKRLDMHHGRLVELEVWRSKLVTQIQQIKYILIGGIGFYVIESLGFMNFLKMAI